MRRREALRLSAGLALLPVAALADQQCDGDDCMYGIWSSRFNFVYAQQQMNEWCWAACIQMVFAYYGHVVRQEEIVQRAWGTTVNFPATGREMYKVLNAPWMDDKGRSFTPSCSVLLDLQYGIANPNRMALLCDDLKNNRPLIIGTLGHAMVMTAIRVLNAPAGPSLMDTVVRDPWPAAGALFRGFSSDPAPGRRQLTWQQVSAAFYLASVRVRD